MGFAGSWVRASARRHALALIGIALLLAIIGGLALCTIAGARRTQSAYPRFLRTRNPSSLAVDVGSVRPGSDGAAAVEEIKRLPQVVSAKPYIAFLVAEWVDGAPVLEHDFEALGSPDGRFFDQDTFTPLEGRLPDPTRADEVAVNEASAKEYGYHVGQQIDLATVSEEDLSDPEAIPQPRLLTHATIVGVGTFIEEVVQDDTDRSTLVLFTPAYVEQARGLETYAWLGLVLRNGTADVADVKRVISERSGPSSVQIFRETALDEFHTEQAIRPISLALASFGAIAALAALVLVGQAIARHIRAEREERAGARAIGAPPGAIALASSIGPIAAVVVGALLAAVAAVLASPLMPIGPVGRVEVDPGFDVDWTVLGLGALGFVVLLSAVTLALARAEQPHRVQRRSLVPPRPSPVQRARALPVTVTTGLRLALETGKGVSAVPVRSVITGTAIAVAALVAAVTFGAGMDHLVSHPNQYGWDWDIGLLAGGGYGNTDPAALQTFVGGDPDVDAYAGAFFGGDTIEGANLPMLGMEPGAPVTPPIRSGRMIQHDDEIVLGTATISRLHKRLGDQVSTSSGPLTIVGTATFPTVSQVHGDHTSLGIGAIVDKTHLPGWDRNCADNPTEGLPSLEECGPNVVFVRFRKGADKQAATARLSGPALQQLDVTQQGIYVGGPQRAAEIASADDIRGSSTLLGGAVALASLVALGVALTAAVRRRRRDLALLKSLGFTRRQLSTAVAWQASATMAVGLLIGIPSGVVVGRELWTLFADQLDVVATPVTPIVACLLVAVGAIVAANLLAALPARFARRVPVAVALRRE